MISNNSLLRRRTLRVAAVCALTICIPVLSSLAAVKANSLPFDRSNPLIWDNDSESDVYSLAMVLSLANKGVIRLIGISQSPDPWKTRSEDYQAIVTKARSSGWKNLPDATADLGPHYMTALTKPQTGRVADTAPLDTAPARMIRDQVLTIGTASKPVVIATGGALTTVASSYLLAARDGRGDEFVSKSIVAASIGLVGLTPIGAEYNATQDTWALYIALTRLQTVLAPLDVNLPLLQQQRLWNTINGLPGNDMGTLLQTVKRQWPYGQDGTIIGDMQPIIAMLYPQEGVYFRTATTVRFDTWLAWPAGYPKNGPPDPAHPERGALNFKALKQILSIRPDARGSNLLLENYDLNVVTNTFLEAFQGAF